MTTKGTALTSSEELKRQREYTEKLQKQGFTYSLVIADAFIRGMRDIGYKHTGTALDELVDNALQAGAGNVHVVFGFEGGSGAKPSQIAVIDDGHGMDPPMIRAAMVWGGTHRENDRSGFGRYGYGLPSASVSQGQCFSVYSIVEGGELNAVTLDLQRMSEYTDGAGGIIVPEAKETTLPSFVSAYMKEHLKGDFTHGTVVIIEKLDRLTWKTNHHLESNLKIHFGVTYRNFVPAITIAVQGDKVRPVDPLFTTPGAQFHDFDEDRAQPLGPTIFEVKDQETGKPLGKVVVRYSYLPPTFARIDKAKYAQRKNANPRLAVMMDHNGIVITRNGRQIDVVTKCPWTVFQNNDRYVNVEVDFDPTLDELFSITTSKQQIVVSDRMWQLLKDQGVGSALEKMRARYKEESAKQEVKQEEPTQKRGSVQVMEDAGKFKPAISAGERTERDQESERRRDEEIRRRAQEFQVPLKEAERQVEAEIQGRPYAVKTESVPGGPFFRPDQVGGQKILWLNTAHGFYTEIYAGPHSTPRLRNGLELLLWAPVELELDATGEAALFYQTARSSWSGRLDVLLTLLSQARSVDEPPRSDGVEVDEGASEAEEESSPVAAGSAGEGGE